MTPPNVTYCGERRLSFDGVRCRVTADGVLVAGAGSGVEWGYGGAGPARLAALLIAHATGDDALAYRAHVWFKWAVVYNWGARWSITAGEVRAWLERWEREAAPADVPAVVCAKGGAA